MPPTKADKKPRNILEEFKIKEAANDYGFSDRIFSIKDYEKNMKIRIVNVSNNGLDLEFDIIGITPALANSFRRIMLSDVPTMAIEKVFVYNNTSIIQDEVLAHRLGLIPLKANPRCFEYKLDEKDEEGNELDTLEYRLDMKCTWLSKDREQKRVDAMYKNHSCYTKDIKWVPKGKQAQLYKEEDVGPNEGDILITKLRPGHEVSLKLLAVKGIGRDHAKFCPVSIATYRMFPEIRLTREVSGQDAINLQKCFSKDVIGIDGNGYAYVKDARYDSNSRNFFMFPNLATAVDQTLVRNHFIFNIESLGAYTAAEIFIEAVKILKKKARALLDELDFEGHA